MRGNRLPEVGWKSMSGVDKDEEPAYRLYFYSVGIILSFDFCLSCRTRSHPLSCYLRLFVDLTKRETLHLSLTQRSLEKKALLLVLGEGLHGHNRKYARLQCILFFYSATKETACLQLIK